MNLKHKTASCLVMTAQFPVIMTPRSVYLIPFKENLSQFTHLLNHATNLR